MLGKVALVTLFITGITIIQVQAAAPTKTAQDVAVAYTKSLQIAQDKYGASSTEARDIATEALTFLITGKDKSVEYGITNERNWNPEEEGDYNQLITLAGDRSAIKIDVEKIGKSVSAVNQTHAAEVIRRYNAVRAGVHLMPMPAGLGYTYMNSGKTIMSTKPKPKTTTAASASKSPAAVKPNTA